MFEEKIFNIKVFKYENLDLLEDEYQYYDVIWNLKSLEKYNGRIITVNINWDITIYAEDQITMETKFNIIEIAEFKKLINGGE